MDMVQLVAKRFPPENERSWINPKPHAAYATECGFAAIAEFLKPL
jgi:hypothetical protein